jgi:hypothetical protein
LTKIQPYDHHIAHYNNLHGWLVRLRRHSIFVVEMCGLVGVTRCVCENVAQNDAQSVFRDNRYVTFTVEKSGPFIGATFVIFSKLPKVNSHPIGENSPNLVTLVLVCYFACVVGVLVYVVVRIGSRF